MLGKLTTKNREREKGILKLHLFPFSGVRGDKPREGAALRVALAGGQEILWDGTCLYWQAEGRRFPLGTRKGEPLFFLGVWEGDGSFRLFFSPHVGTPKGEILALRVGEGWLEAERWRKGASGFPGERIDGKILPLGFGEGYPEEVASLVARVWGEHP